MNKPCARITLDLQQASTPTFVAVKKSDIGREIRITLSDGGFSYEISADCYAVLTGTKPDGNILYNHCDIEGNTIVYTVTEQTTAAAGRMKAEVKLYGADDILVTSATFRIIIDGTVYNEGKVESKDEVSALTHLVSEAAGVINNGNQMIEQGQQTIQSAETATQEATNAAGSATSAAGNANDAATTANAAAQNVVNAANQATAAATAANSAASNAETATRNANTATNNASAAADRANTAASNAETATRNANTATNNASAAADRANTAASNAETATRNANTATNNASAAADRANTAASEAVSAAKRAEEAADSINSSGGNAELKDDLCDYLHVDSDNIFDPSKVTKNKYVNSNGEELDSSSYELSKYIPVPFAGDNYLYFNKDAVSSEYSDYKGVHQIILYDSNKIFIKRVACIGALYVGFNQANAKYMRLMIGSNTKDLMVVVSNKYDATFSPTYIPYGGVYSENFKNEVNDIIDKRQENDTERPLEHIIRDGGLTRIFRTAGVVGDSLSIGCMEYKDSSGNALGYDRYEFSWIQQMRGICGFDKAENFSVGGLTSKTFWTTQSQKVKNLREDGANHKCQLYFIALGVNDIADTTMEVGTPNDISIESSTTFYGYYSRIIKLIQSQQPKARIFLVGLPNHSNMTKWGARFRNFRDAIADMVNHFNFVYYIDLYQYELPYDSEFQKIYFNGFHENALGYARTAWVISSYIDWYIRHNYEEFREVGFIGTDYHYYD